MPFISFENVIKRFMGSPVLDGLSFSVEKGEILCIAGLSGVGKSVTLKHLVRLMTPTSGKVVFDGIDVASCGESDLAKVRGRIGYLFQGGALIAWMTVAENVALPLRETTILSDEEIDERVAAALKAVDLSDAADKYPSEISGGMQKRAGLARAVVRNPEVVLYDEPTSGLDPITSATINRLIVKLNKSFGMTSLVVTHDLQSALAFADRIMLVVRGRAVEISKPKDFLESKNPDVAEYIAAMKGEMK